jgi:hypothetical protein
VAVFNRRNALLGWSYWQSKRIKRRMKRATRPVDRRRQRKSLIALAAAGLAGAMALKRSRRRGQE